MRLYDRRLHDAARHVYKIVFSDDKEILANLDAMIVVNFWDNILEFFVSDSGNLILWHRNPKLDMEFVYSVTECKFYNETEYYSVIDEHTLKGFVYY